MRYIPQLGDHFKTSQHARESNIRNLKLRLLVQHCENATITVTFSFCILIKIKITFDLEIDQIGSSERGLLELF